MRESTHVQYTQERLMHIPTILLFNVTILQEDME